MSDKDDNSGKIALIGSVGVTALIMVVGLSWSHFRGPDGALEAWLVGDAVLVEEFRSTEDGTDERFVLHDLKTGKRLADRDPGDLSKLFVMGDRLWLYGRRDYGLEAWSLKDLKTQVTARQFQGVRPSESSVCSDGVLARILLTDGHYAVLDLATGKTVPEQEVRCQSFSRPAPLSSGGGSPLGPLGTPREGASQRSKVTVAGAPYGGAETFLEPQFVRTDNGQAVVVDEDVFVVHRVQLGEDRRQQLTRVGQGRARWTVSLGTSTSFERVLFAPPSTLVMVGHEGVTTLDAATGKVLWRTGS